MGYPIECSLTSLQCDIEKTNINVIIKSEQGNQMVEKITLKT